jgi:uncharacterized protein YndB with AHSA1/START domain
MKPLITALALALMATPAMAAETFPDVRNTSTVDAGGSRVLQLSIDLNAPLKAVWDAFADAPTVRRWSAPLAIIDLKQGGSMEESYNAKAQAGDPENIRHDIVAYVPGQLIVFRNTNAPSGLPGREFYKRVVSILQVQDLGGGRTRLMISQTGYAPGPEFDKLYAFFQEDNAELMEALKSALENPKGKLYVAAK